MSYRSSARSERFWSTPHEELTSINSLPASSSGNGSRNKKRRPHVSDFRLRTKRLAAAVRQELGVDSVTPKTAEGERERQERASRDDSGRSKTDVVVLPSEKPRRAFDSTLGNDSHRDVSADTAVTHQSTKKPLGRARLYATFDDKTLEMRVDRMRLRMQTRLGDDFPRCLKPLTADAAGFLSSEASSVPASSRYFDRGQQPERDALSTSGAPASCLSDEDSILWLTDSDSASSEDAESSSSSVTFVGSVPLSQADLSKRPRRTENGSESQLAARNSCSDKTTAADDSDEMICSRSSDEEGLNCDSVADSQDVSNVAELFAALHKRDKTNIDRINICLLCDSHTCPRATVVRGACQARRCGHCFMWKHNASKCNHNSRNERSRSTFLQKANECFEDCMKASRMVKSQILQSQHPWSATCVICEKGGHYDPFKVNCGDPPTAEPSSVETSAHDTEKISVAFFPLEYHIANNAEAPPIARHAEYDSSYRPSPRDSDITVPPQPPAMWTGAVPLPPRPPPESCWPGAPYVEQHDRYHYQDIFDRRGNTAAQIQPYAAVRARVSSAYGPSDRYDYIGVSTPFSGAPDYRLEDGHSVYNNSFRESSFPNNSELFRRFSSGDDGLANGDVHYGSVSLMAAGREYLDTGSAYQHPQLAAYQNQFFQEPQRELRQRSHRTTHSGVFPSYHHQRDDRLYDSNATFPPPNEEYPPLPPGG